MQTNLKLKPIRQQRPTAAKRYPETEATRLGFTTPWNLVRTFGRQALMWVVAYTAIGLLFTIIRLILSR